LHIPDTVIGPLTYIPLYVVMIFIWLYAGYRLKKTLRSKQVPMMAMLAAFSFVIMMINLPVVMGTSGHATGGAIMGIILGPWAAVIAMTVTLIIQALLFGDGGLTTLGANSFNMAFIIPFSAYIIYRIMSGRSPVTSKRRLVAAVIAGYFSLVLASACCGFELGIQPVLYPASQGYTYIQFPLSVTMPVMVGSHLFFGIIEALATGLIFAYLQVNDPTLLEGKKAWLHRETNPSKGLLANKMFRTLLLILGVLIILTPIGLYLGGETFGENASSTLWNAPLADYGIPGVSTTMGTVLGYVASAIVGVVVCGGVLYLLGRLAARNDHDNLPLKQGKNVGSEANKGTAMNVTGDMIIPEWMRASDAGPGPSNMIPKKRKNHIQNTLSGILNFFEDSVTSESYTLRNGILQSLDPRVKLVSILALILAISMTMDWKLLVTVYLLVLVFAYLSRIEIGFFIKRVWLFIPIFAGIIALPMLFNVFYPGDSLVTLATPGPGAWLGPFRLPETISITAQGIAAALIFTLRVATGVSATVLLVLTTPREKLFKSLRSVGVPRVYVLTLDMCYRYIFMFTDLVRAFYTAKKSRTIKRMSLLEEQKWVGGRIGYTLVKSLDMGEKVHGAMVSRGYTGDVKILEDFRLKPRDYAAAVSVLAFSAILILASRHIIMI